MGAAVMDGYVRLSRDDHKRQYTSIENQKKIIRKYAEENHMVVRRIYEDDGSSGYSFERPAFQEMMADLNDIRIIVAKDLSRIGRHNARVLLFLEEMEEQGKRVILIDDNYDSLYTDDDMIGIKTWDNERHVKSTSRKVRRIKKMEQENGTLISEPPFGYIRHPLNRQMVLIDEEAAAILQLQKDLYLEGNGIRRTAEILSERGVPTPSMLKKERLDSLGLPCRRKVADQWSYGMVKDTLFNDYHNGILRTHKRERVTINGKDKKVPEEQQYVFPDHHPKIFDDETRRLLCEVRDSRHHSSYRGQRRHENLFSGCLYCQDCGRKLTAINRPNREKYYVCGTYNKKGKQFCTCAHTITEDTLKQAMLAYLAFCRNCLKDQLEKIEAGGRRRKVRFGEESREKLEAEADRIRKELKILVEQKIREMAADPAQRALLSETYDALQTEKMNRLSAIEKRLEAFGQETFPAENRTVPGTEAEPGELAEQTEKSAGRTEKSTRQTGKSAGRTEKSTRQTGKLAEQTGKSALEVLDQMLEQKALTRTDLEILVEKIVVDRDGNAAFYFKYGLGCCLACDPVWKLGEQA